MKASRRPLSAANTKPIRRTAKARRRIEEAIEVGLIAFPDGPSVPWVAACAGLSPRWGRQAIKDFADGHPRYELTDYSVRPRRIRRRSA